MTVNADFQPAPPRPGRSLADLRPDLAAEWSTENDRLPSEVGPGSRYVAQWICKARHTWTATVQCRAYHAGGCPMCPQRVVKGVNDLATVRPDLVEQWHPDNGYGADEIAHQSLKVALWRCARGHVWRETVKLRYQGYACPTCVAKNRASQHAASPRTPARGGSLAELRPDAASQWVQVGHVTPADVSPGSEYVATWRCEDGHTWEAQVRSRARRAGSGCPQCSGLRRIRGVNDLATLHPDLAQEWSEHNRVSAAQVSPESIKAVEWKCPARHIWFETPQRRIRMGLSCPTCARLSETRQVARPSVAEKHPELVAEWSPRNDRASHATPASSRELVQWVCARGHEWAARIEHRVSTGKGCTTCESVRIRRGDNDLATRRPDLVPRWHPNNPLGPDAIPFQSKRTMLWLCERGHTYESTPLRQSRSANGRCPQCPRRATTPVEPGTSLADTHPAVAAQWHPSNALAPNEITWRSERRVDWVCDAGHIFAATVLERARGRRRGNCPDCRPAEVARRA